MEVLIQLHATTALSPGNESAVPFELEDEHSTPVVLPGFELSLAEQKVDES
jgi:N-methylhydantoinase A/oxoprolinase/acetone carboxylase beta subunit